MHVIPVRDSLGTPIGKRAPVERIQLRLIRAADDRCAEAYRLLIANNAQDRDEDHSMGCAAESGKWWRLAAAKP